MLASGLMSKLSSANTVSELASIVTGAIALLPLEARYTAGLSGVTQLGAVASQIIDAANTSPPSTVKALDAVMPLAVKLEAPAWIVAGLGKMMNVAAVVDALLKMDPNAAFDVLVAYAQYLSPDGGPITTIPGQLPEVPGRRLASGDFSLDFLSSVPAAYKDLLYALGKLAIAIPLNSALGRMILGGDASSAIDQAAKILSCDDAALAGAISFAAKNINKFMGGASPPPSPPNAMTPLSTVAKATQGLVAALPNASSHAVAIAEHQELMTSAVHHLFDDVRLLRSNRCAAAATSNATRVTPGGFKPYWSRPPLLQSFSISPASSKGARATFAAAGVGMVGWLSTELSFDMDGIALGTLQCKAGQPVPITVKIGQRDISMRFFTKSRPATAWPTGFTIASGYHSSMPVARDLAGAPIFPTNPLVNMDISAFEVQPYAQVASWFAQSAASESAQSRLLRRVLPTPAPGLSFGNRWWDAHDAFRLEVSSALLEVQGEAASICASIDNEPVGEMRTYDAAKTLVQAFASAPATAGGLRLNRVAPFTCELCVPPQTTQPSGVRAAAFDFVAFQRTLAQPAIAALPLELAKCVIWHEQDYLACGTPKYTADATFLNCLSASGALPAGVSLPVLESLPSWWAEMPGLPAELAAKFDCDTYIHAQTTRCTCSASSIAVGTPTSGPSLECIRESVGTTARRSTGLVTNRPKDVAHVSRRLHELGFLAGLNSGNAGANTVSEALEHALRVFSAASRGDLSFAAPCDVDGNGTLIMPCRVSNMTCPSEQVVPGTPIASCLTNATLADVDPMATDAASAYHWLSAINAPRWQKLPSDATGVKVDSSATNLYGTHWLMEALVSAGRHYFVATAGEAITVMGASTRLGGLAPAKAAGEFVPGAQSGLLLELACPAGGDALSTLRSALAAAHFVVDALDSTCTVTINPPALGARVPRVHAFQRAPALDRDTRVGITLAGEDFGDVTKVAFGQLDCEILSLKSTDLFARCGGTTVGWVAAKPSVTTARGATGWACSTESVNLRPATDTATELLQLQMAGLEQTNSNGNANLSAVAESVSMFENTNFTNSTSSQLCNTLRPLLTSLEAIQCNLARASSVDSVALSRIAGGLEANLRGAHADRALSMATCLEAHDVHAMYDERVTTPAKQFSRELQQTITIAQKAQSALTSASQKQLSATAASAAITPLLGQLDELTALEPRMGELGGSVSLAVTTVGHFQKAMPEAPYPVMCTQFTPTLATTNVNALIPQLSSINTQMAVLFPLMGVVAASIAMMQCSLANSNELSGVTGSTMQVLSVRSLDPSPSPLLPVS